MRHFIKYSLILLLLHFSCNKNKNSAPTIDPLTYTKNLDGYLKCSGTILHHNPYTNYDTVTPFSFESNIHVLNNATFTYSDINPAIIDTFRYVQNIDSTLVFVYVDTTYRSIAYMYQFDTIWYNYSRNSKKFNIYDYDKGYVQYFKLQAQ